jgi:ABC-type dipeptide/oligopeptide/nickel transport system permease subunit
MGNYPNPFNPTTTITFPLIESDFRGGRPAKVTIQILNVLQQHVAYPLAMDNPAGNGPVNDLLYTQPGNYKAFWDGTDRTGRKVASGIYYAVLVVNGERDAPRKLVVTK